MMAPWGANLADANVVRAGHPPALGLDEDEELFQHPSVGLHSSVALAALFALEVAKLLHQLAQRLGHGLGPPARATTTRSPGLSIGRDDPPVKPFLSW